MRQCDSPNNQDDGRVRIYTHLRASNTNILLATTLNAVPHPEDSTLEANVNLELYGQEREKTLRWGCVQTDISIMFPWNMTRFESLKVQHRNRGDVDVWFDQHGNSSHLGAGAAVDVRSGVRHGYNYNNNSFKNTYNAGAGGALLPPPEAPRIIFDCLDIKTYQGYVYLTNTHVSEELKVVSEQSAIVGQITAGKRIELESKLHTTLALTSSNASDLDLKVSAETVARVSMVMNERVIVFFSLSFIRSRGLSKRTPLFTLFFSPSFCSPNKTSLEVQQSPFHGHVALTTWVSFFRPEVFFNPDDTFVQQTKTLQTLTGYFSYANGTKPESPFPRVRVNGEQASFALGR